MSRGAAAAAACALLLTLTACSDSSKGAPESSRVGSDAPAATTSAPVAGRESVRVALIRPAMDLLEERLGGTQRYVEVNVTQTEVNLFVLRDGLDFAYVVRSGVIEDPAEGVAYAGPSFTAAELEFVPTVIDVVVQNMTESDVVAFSARAREGGIDYIATVRTPKREFRVLLGADGRVLDME